MPIYLYRCGSCKETREYFLNSGQEPLRCSECDETKLTRVYHGQTVSKGSSRNESRSGLTEHVLGYIPLPCGAIAQITLNPKSK